MDSRSLVKAVRSADLSAVERCLEAGVDPNEPTPRGARALTTAVKATQPRLVEFLLARGADPTQLDAQGLSPAAHCQLKSHEPRLRRAQQTIRGLLESAGAGFDDESSVDLWHASGHGELARVRELLDAGAPTDPPSLHPLGIAAAQGHGDVVVALIEAGARVDRIEGEATALGRAAKAGHADVVELLLAAGADVEPHGTLGNATYFAWCGRHWALQSWLERQTGQKARRPLHVEYRPGSRDPSWRLFVDGSDFGGNGEYSALLVRASIDDVSPAVRDAMPCQRVLAGIDTEPQPLQVDEHPHYAVQLTACSWTLLTHELGNVHRPHAAEAIAHRVSKALHCRVVHAVWDDTSCQDTFVVFDSGRKEGSGWSEPQMVDEGVRLPGLDTSGHRGPILTDVEPQDVVRVDALV